MQAVSSYTHETVPTQFCRDRRNPLCLPPLRQAGIGSPSVSGLSQLQHGWLGPSITNGFAKDHEVILFDNAGVGASGWNTSSTVVDITKHCTSFCGALDLKRVDVVGNSLGGMITQQLAQNHLHRVNRLILLGTAPRGEEGMTFTELSPEKQEADPIAFLLAPLFAPSESSQKAGRAHVARLGLRTQDRDFPVSVGATEAQIEALKEWAAVPKTGRYAMLRNIPHPTLIAQDDKDIVVAPN